MSQNTNVEKEAPVLDEKYALDGILGRFSKPQVDDLEYCFIEREWSVKKIAKNRDLTERVVRKLLLHIGLEIDNKVKEGYVRSGKAICLEKAYEV